ncbi:MAG: DNA recombination protein RmuC [Chloroflexi bacterium]|nr:MAG: DNA recombination protein RmuC [Chloroflexota bacterium]
MDVATLLALAAALAAVAALAIVIRRRPGDGGTVALSAQIQSAQQGMQGNVQLLAASLDELRGEVHRSLGATEQQLTTQTGATQRTLSDLSRQLGALSEQGQRIGELAKDIGSLQDLLRAPKARGGFAERVLDRARAVARNRAANETPRVPPPGAPARRGGLALRLAGRRHDRLRVHVHPFRGRLLRRRVARRGG